MKITTKSEVLEILTMEDDTFARDVRPLARQLVLENGNVLYGTAMLGYSNVCRSRCLYCGMRADSKIERYRIPAGEVNQSLELSSEMGLKRVFFISGEDPKYGFDQILSFCIYAKTLDFHVTLGAGELPKEQFEQLREVGVDAYAMKFEMSNPDTFNRLNPSTDFKTRMRNINWIRDLGFELASGNIIDYPGMTLDEMADDILLMKSLEISWAPVIPYMPAAGTPLAQEGGPGRLPLLYKEIAILRLMMPDIYITAQQPGPDFSKGLATTEGNVAAIEAGANILFVDLLPDAMAKNFSVIDNRSVLRLSHVREIAELTGMRTIFT